jgi:hypothetical protein
MFQRIRELLRATPFIPFKIKTSDGKEYLVPTADHGAVAPEKYSKVIVFDDAERETHISVLHIVGVETTVITR